MARGRDEILELPRPRILSWLVQEHFDELDALWERREALIFDFEWTIRDLAEHERRTSGHLKGLRVGQGHALDVARSGFEADDRWAALAATLTLLSFRNPELDSEVVDRLAGAEGETGHGLRLALRHHALSAEMEAGLRQCLAGSAGPGRLHALDVLAFRRRPLAIDPAELLGCDDPELETQIVEAIGRVGGRWDRKACLDALSSEVSGTRRAALTTSIRTGLSDLLGLTREAAARSDGPVPEALELLGVIGGENEIRLLRSALGNEATAASALEGLAASGLAAAVPAILDVMDDPKRLHDAGRAFLQITRAPDVAPVEPVDPPEGLSEEEVDFWDEWPPVEPARARDWWARNQARHATGRWQAGIEIGPGPLTADFAGLPLSGRRTAYLRALQVAPAETPDLELEAAASVQMESQMGVGSGLGSGVGAGAA